MDIQADLSLQWTHMSEGTFSHVAAQFVNANKRKSFYNVQSSFRIYNLQSVRIFRICFVFLVVFCLMFFSDSYWI